MWMMDLDSLAISFFAYSHVRTANEKTQAVRKIFFLILCKMWIYFVYRHDMYDSYETSMF